MKILFRKEIEEALSIPSVFGAIERGFVAYSRGEAVVPPVASLHFDHPRGECHIKYGYIKKGRHYVVKIASGFYENPRRGLPSNQGLVLLFDQETGAAVCALFDEGYLTDVRTAVAGALAAKYLAPKRISCIGMVGTGAQAYFQLRYLAFTTSCRRAMIWGRDVEKARKLANHPEFGEWTIEVAQELDELATQCNLIITTTASSKSLLFAEQIRAGTHVTAVGADDLGKQELDPHIFGKADRVFVDSRSQCAAFGDTSYALKEGVIKMEKLIELGQVIADPSFGRTDEDQITVCDLTGLAVSDLQIAESIYQAK